MSFNGDIKNFRDFIAEFALIIYNFIFIRLDLCLAEIRRILSRLTNLAKNTKIKHRLITTSKSTTHTK